MNLSGLWVCLTVTIAVIYLLLFEDSFKNCGSFKNYVIYIYIYIFYYFNHF